jgi:hypothetical protein
MRLLHVGHTPFFVTSALVTLSGHAVVNPHSSEPAVTIIRTVSLSKSIEANGAATLVAAGRTADIAVGAGAPRGMAPRKGARR